VKENFKDMTTDYYKHERGIASNRRYIPTHYEISNTAEHFIDDTHRADLTEDAVRLPDYVVDDVGSTFLPPTPLHEVGDSVHPVGASSLLDYLARELHRYRKAVARMGQDIVNLTDEVRQLQEENASLRQGSGYGEKEFDEMSLQYASLTERYNAQTAELRRCQDLMQKLENNQTLLQDQTARVRKLEEACRRQEQVITEMEMQLAEKSRGDGQRAKAYELLLSENSRLREELTKHMEDSRRYYNEYADYLNRYWNPSSDELFEVHANGGSTTAREAATLGNTRPTRVRESYSLAPKYRSYRTPEDFMKETGFEPEPVHSNTARTDYSVRIPATSTRYYETTKTVR